MLSHCYESCRTHNRFPNLGIWQRDWEPLGSLILEASGIWLQNFHRTGEADSWRAHTKPCAHRDPGERISVHAGVWARLARACPGASGGLRVIAACCRQGPWVRHARRAFWSGCRYLRYHAAVWPRPNSREGALPQPSTENWIKDLLSVAPPIRIEPSFPHCQSLPSERVHKSLIFIHPRADRMKTTITEN